MTPSTHPFELYIPTRPMCRKYSSSLKPLGVGYVANGLSWRTTETLGRHQDYIHGFTASTMCILHTYPVRQRCRRSETTSEKCFSCLPLLLLGGECFRKEFANRSLGSRRSSCATATLHAGRLQPPRGVWQIHLCTVS